MNYFLTTLFNLLVILALVIPGFALKKARLVSDKAVKDFSNVLLYVGTPFLIFATMLETDIYSVSVLNIVICVVLTVAVHLLGIGLSYLVTAGDKDRSRKAVCAFSSAFSNCGFLGIPLTYALVPDEYLAEALLYVAIYNVVFNFLTWIIGTVIYTEKGNRDKKAMLTAILNPCTIGFLLALPFVLTGINLIEVAYVGSFIKYLSGICVPVSMLVLGFRVANINVPSMLKNKYVYISSVIRLLLVPLATLAIALLLRMVPGIDTAFIMAMVVMAAMPTAASAIAMAEKFDADSLLVSETVISSTLLSVITVPVMLLLVSLV